MSQPELLSRVIEVLDASGTPYMLTGSLASSLQGEPRSTHDIDLVLAIHEPGIQAILAAFPPRAYHLDEQDMRHAVDRCDLFTVTDLREGDKVDFWLLTDDAFDQSRFARRQETAFRDLRVWVSRPEDTILPKLKWCKLLGGSQKHYHDALRVFEIQHRLLDSAYLDAWAEALGVVPLLARLRADAQPL